MSKRCRLNGKECRPGLYCLLRPTCLKIYDHYDTLMSLLAKANLQIEWISLAAVQVETVWMIDNNKGHIRLIVAHTQNAIVKITLEGDLFNDDYSVQQVL